LETKVKHINCSAKKRKIQIATWIKLLLMIAGTIFVGLGVIGIFLPVIPATPFLLLAAACYARSSRRFYCWLLNNRWFGVYIKNYRQKKGMPLKMKILTVALLWLTILISVIFVVQSLTLRIVLIIIAIGVSVHLLSLKTLKE
jgi:uncharacterized membrane protein YbaN (DUF454 family)